MATIGDQIIDSNLFGWNRQGQYYKTEITIEPGYGCWIYCYQDCQLLTEYLPLNPDPFITELETGWNLVGNPHLPPHYITMLLFKYQEIYCNWSDATTSNNPTGNPLIDMNFFGWNPGQYYEIVSQLEPSRAYWIYDYTTCGMYSTTW